MFTTAVLYQVAHCYTARTYGVVPVHVFVVSTTSAVSGTAKLVGFRVRIPVVLLIAGSVLVCMICMHENHTRKHQCQYVQ